MRRALGWLTCLFLSFICAASLAADGARNLAVKASGERRLALVIGNDSYQNISVLRNAGADARAIARGLDAAGFNVTLKLDLTEKAMKETLRAFKGRLGGGDVAVFFYAGHGVQLGAANYLLPVDIRGDNEEQVKDEAIPLQRVLDDMQEQKTKFALAIIDACRNNPFKGTGRSIGGRGLAPTTAATGQMVLFSAGAGQEALDRVGPNDRNPNGLFTRVLLKEMERPGVPADRVLRNVREEVVKVAKSINHDQVPALYDQVVGDFYFRPPGPGGATTSGPAAATHLPSDAEVEQGLWESIKDSANAEPIEEYLRQYPSGRYVPNAKVLLAKLRAANSPRPAAIQPAATQLALAPPTATTPSPARPLAPADGSYPAKPVRIVVPFAPGGSTDVIGRILTEQLTRLSGQPFIVENRAGAGGTIGSDAVAKAYSDGYTLLLGSTATHALAPSLYSKLPYDAQRDFVPVGLLAESPQVLVASAAAGFFSISDLLRQAKANPGKFSYASSGIGSLAHLAGEQFALRAGISVVHVPYRGAAPAVTDLLGGHVHFMFSDFASVLPHVQSGKLRALALAAAKRSPLLPEIPTMAEAGVTGADAGNWIGLLAPAGTPSGVVSRLSQLLGQALQTPDVRSRIEALGYASSAPSPERLGDAIRNDGQRWAGVIRNGNIRVD